MSSVLNSTRPRFVLTLINRNRNYFYSKRKYSELPKRFYKNTGVLHYNGDFEVTLDRRKLKTPKGDVFKVQNELLALGVASEWDAQKDVIDRSSMHLTTLCNTAQDNPQNVNKHDAVQFLCNYMETDTILFYSRNEDLLKLQEKEWGAVLDWFRKRFLVEVTPTKDIHVPNVPEKTRLTIQRHLLSYNLSAIHGFTLAIESLKSVILALSCVERKLTVDQAVFLTMIEEEYQTNSWGRVEWSHDVNRVNLQSRVAAAVMFIHLNSMSEDTKSKLISVI